MTFTQKYANGVFLMFVPVLSVLTVREMPPGEPSAALRLVFAIAETFSSPILFIVWEALVLVYMGIAVFVGDDPIVPAKESGKVKVVER